VESIQWISKPEDFAENFLFFQKKIFKAIRKKFLMAQAQLLPLAALLLLIGPAREFIFIMHKNFQLTGRKSALVLLYSQPSLGVASFQDKTASIKIIQPKKLARDAL